MLCPFFLFSCLKRGKTFIFKPSMPLFPLWAYLLVFLIAVGAILAVTIYHRLTWSIIVARILKRDDGFLSLGRRTMYDLQYDLQGKTITTRAASRLVRYEDGSLVVLVNPHRPTEVRILYPGAVISQSQNWVGPILGVVGIVIILLFAFSVS